MFSTLAHEGYPGHLYQTNYFLSTNPSPLRTFLHCDGYDEGMGDLCPVYTAIILQNLKMSMKKHRHSSASYIGIMTALTLPVLSERFICNYKNYDENALADYLKTYGIDKSATNNFTNTLLKIRLLIFLTVLDIMN